MICARTKAGNGAAHCAALQYEKGRFGRTGPWDYFTVSLAEALVTVP